MQSDIEEFYEIDLGQAGFIHRRPRHINIDSFNARFKTNFTQKDIGSFKVVSLQKVKSCIKMDFWKLRANKYGGSQRQAVERQFVYKILGVCLCLEEVVSLKRVNNFITLSDIRLISSHILEQFSAVELSYRRICDFITAPETDLSFLNHHKTLLQVHEQLLLLHSTVKRGRKRQRQPFSIQNTIIIDSEQQLQDISGKQVWQRPPKIRDLHLSHVYTMASRFISYLTTPESSEGISLFFRTTKQKKMWNQDLKQLYQYQKQYIKFLEFVFNRESIRILFVDFLKNQDSFEETQRTEQI